MPSQQIVQSDDFNQNISLKNYESSDKIINHIKQTINEKFKQYPNQFDTCDIDNLQSNDQLIKQFIRLNAHKKTNITTESTSQLINYLHWRKAEGINNLKQSDFPKEFYEWGVTCFRLDKENKKLSFYM